MSLIRTIDAIEYPETDGKPMGETDLHIEWIIRIRDMLRWRYRDQPVYVASNMLIYYVENEPTKFVVPDDYVVLNCEWKRRRVFKIWEEGRWPNVVFEITSRSTRREDQVFKLDTYAKIGVEEYFLFDPEGEYLDPPVQGFRLDVGEYHPIDADDGVLRCEQLGILLALDAGKLVLRDAASGQTLLTEAEAQAAALKTAEAQRQAAEAQRKTERAARQEAERQLDQAQAELQRLREQLRRKGDS